MEYEIIMLFDNKFSELEMKDIINKKLSVIMNVMESN